MAAVKVDTAKVDTVAFKNIPNGQNGVGEDSNEHMLPTTCPPVTITTLDGETFEIADTPVDPAKVTAFAAEAMLRKFWDNAQEDQAWQTIAGEI